MRDGKKTISINCARWKVISAQNMTRTTKDETFKITIIIKKKEIP